MSTIPSVMPVDVVSAKSRPIYKSLFVQVLAGLVLGVILGIANPTFAVQL